MGQSESLGRRFESYRAHHISLVHSGHTVYISFRTTYATMNTRGCDGTSTDFRAAAVAMTPGGVRAR